MMLLRCIAIAAAGAAFWSVTILATACDGGEGQPGPEPDAGQQGTPIAATPVPRSTVDPNVPLVEYHSPDKGYTVSYPEGWKIDAPPGGAIDTFIWTEDGMHLAQLAVTRNADAVTPDELMRLDVSIVTRYGGRIDPAQTREMQVGGTTGKLIMYSVNAGGLPIEQAVVYASHGDYGWRLGLSTYGAGSLPGYLSVFQRIIASFQPG